MPLVATFLQHEKEHEQHVVNKKELRAHEEMGHIDELTFKEAEYEQVVIDRLNEVKNHPEEERTAVELYVVEGELLEGSRIQQQMQQRTLEQSFLELTSLLYGGAQ